MLNLSKLDTYTVLQLISSLKDADTAYFNEDPIMEDAEYDVVKQCANRMDPSNEYFLQVGSQVRGGKVDLPHKMGSLNQVYNGEIKKWIQSNGLSNDAIVVSDKLDGTSVLIEYSKYGTLQIAYSRGNGIQGADITRHASKMPNVPQQIESKGELVRIRAENIISPVNFARINTGKFSRGNRIYKNPRNMVAGQMNASEVSAQIYEVIDTIAYEIVGSILSKSEQLVQLMQWGFVVAEFTVIPQGSKLNDIMLTEFLGYRKAATKYEIDGIVLDVDSPVTRKRIATDDLNPKYAVKYKVADASNIASTEVINVEWNLSKSGYFKPRLQFKPVNLMGVTIQHATGFNAKFIKDNLIGPGAVIRIVRAGDVTPYIESVVSGSPTGAQMPTQDGHWTETDVDFVINDAHSNDIVAFEQLKEFFTSIDVEFLGEGNLRPMFDAGFTTPESIIPMTQEDFGSLLGSTIMGKKIFTAMRKSLTNIPLYALMGAHPAMGRGVGVRKMKKLYDAWDGNMVNCTSIERIVAVAGFDTKTATKVAAGYGVFMEFLTEVNPYVSLATFEAKKQGHLSGKVFCFTGFRSGEMEALIVEAGGTIGSGVSSKTTYLVTAEPGSTSGKAAKARAAGVMVIGLEELKNLVNV